MTLAEFLMNTLKTKPTKSKKWIVTVVGISCVMLVFFIGMIGMVKANAIAQQIVSLCTIVITFMGSITGAYTIGQSFVDWKSTATIESYSKQEDTTSNINLKADENVIQYYKLKYKDEPSYAPIDYLNSIENVS